MLTTKGTKITNNFDFEEEIIHKNKSEFCKGVIFFPKQIIYSQFSRYVAQINESELIDHTLFSPDLTPSE
jgi:hypothetical protein